MSGTVNKVIIVGNLGRDPEVKTSASGKKSAVLSIATGESWRDKATGERKERTDWHRVVIFSEPLVEIAEKYLRTGAKVYLEGQLQTRKWTDQGGATRYSTEVVLSAFRSQLQMIGRKDGAAPSDDSYGTTTTRTADDKPRGTAQQDMDDEIPF